MSFDIFVFLLLLKKMCFNWIIFLSHRYKILVNILCQSFVFFNLFSVYIDFGFKLRNFVDSTEIQSVSIIDGDVSLNIFVLLHSNFWFE